MRTIFSSQGSRIPRGLRGAPLCNRLPPAFRKVGHRLGASLGVQPKPLTASDYCYYDRPHFLIQDPDLRPLTFRLCLLQHNHPPVVCRLE
jgi:hypothetical protein